MKGRRLSLTLIILLCVSLSILPACSPLYVMRAGWEETGILLRRQSIQKLVNSPDTDPVLRRKLKLVLEARDFSETIGLSPEESYTQYSHIDRDVLVWVLNAAPQTALEPYTWWFPIVGSVPYKGYFEREDADKDAKKLSAEGYDTSIRPSMAFSTLGWFNDPLLSTLVKFHEVTLIETVIHEILHNTVWVKNNVEFNETLANFVGNKGAELFFIQNDMPQHAVFAADNWNDELAYARFLEELSVKLKELYSKLKNNSAETTKTEVLEEREIIFQNAKKEWADKAAELRTNRFQLAASTVNNAAIVADRIYLTQPEQFQALFAALGNSMPDFIKAIKDLADEANAKDADPYLLLSGRITPLEATPNLDN